MDQERYEWAPTERVRQYAAEIDRIVKALGHPEALVTDESRVSDFPIGRDAGDVSLIELRRRLGVRIHADDRLVDVVQRMHEAQQAIIKDHHVQPYDWISWLEERDAEALLICLMQAIERGTSLETLRRMVEGWRANAHQALTADDYHASVDNYLEVSVDARLYVLASPDLLDRQDDEHDQQEP